VLYGNGLAMITRKDRLVIRGAPTKVMRCALVWFYKTILDEKLKKTGFR
jgi:hypothetical protein